MAPPAARRSEVSGAPTVRAFERSWAMLPPEEKKRVLEVRRRVLGVSASVRVRMWLRAAKVVALRAFRVRASDRVAWKRGGAVDVRVRVILASVSVGCDMGTAGILVGSWWGGEVVGALVVGGQGLVGAVGTVGRTFKEL